jgi:hypothetical protein
MSTGDTRRTDMSESITIRHSTQADASRLAELAELDGRRAPAGDTLLAYVDGELRAALGTVDGRVVADPFHLSDDVVRLLALRATQEQDGGGRRRILGWPSVGHRLGREGVAA